MLSYFFCTIIAMLRQKVVTMNMSNYEKTEYLINHWWLSLFVGLAAICAGFLILVNPVESYYTFAVWLGLAIFLSGGVGIVQGLSSKNYFVHRGWLMIVSAADIIIGLVLILNALISEIFMPVLLGVWLLYRGAVMLVQGFELRGYGIRDAGWVVFYASLIIALAVAVLWLPMTFGIEAVVIFVAIAFVAYGISTISLAYRLWEVHRHAKALGSNE